MTAETLPESAVEAEVILRRYRTSGHMVGWEAFGTEKQEEPDHREIGLVTFVKGKTVMKPYPDADRWPASEVHGGVAAISIHSYGDYPKGAFITVSGPDRDAVREAWFRARDTFLACAESLWTAGGEAGDVQ